jgi:ABC-type multidrug transport system fused ATPase/permease subunit
LVFSSKFGGFVDTKILALASFGIASGASAIIFGLIDDLDEFIAGMDPNEIMARCLSDTRTQEEKLEEAYSKAIKRAYNLFISFLIEWILLGISTAILLYFGIPYWLTTISLIVFSLGSLVSFVLWIISYLRYKDYTKQLLVIQLKKSDKAEISIKI